MNIDWEQVFLTIVAVGVAALICLVLGLIFVGVTADHSIVKYELGANEKYEREEDWTVVGVREWSNDDHIRFSKDEYTFEQMKEKVETLNDLLLRQEVREFED